MYKIPSSQFRKYGNKITEIDGIKFHSRAEAVRYTELKLLVRIGDIKDLVLQPKFLLQEGFINKRTGKKEHPIYYVSDFQYTTRTGVKIVEDKKGAKTKDYLIKKKMFLYKYQDQFEFKES